MALTEEQKGFRAEVDNFLVEVQGAIKEAKELAVKVRQQNRRFGQLEKLIKAMAKEHNIK